ncbi:LPXTG cell wall anchor domain-containing protein, partial [Streptococcus suis]
AIVGDVQASVPVQIRAAASGVTPPVPTAPTATAPLAVTGGTVSIAALVLGLLALAAGVVIRRRRRVGEN